MIINTKAQKFLESCRIIGDSEVKEGIIVTIDSNACFDVISFYAKKLELKSIQTFDWLEIFDVDQSRMILNFQNKMKKIAGKKRYYIESTVYDIITKKNDEI